MSSKRGTTATKKSTAQEDWRQLWRERTSFLDNIEQKRLQVLVSQFPVAIHRIILLENELQFRKTRNGATMFYFYRSNLPTVFAAFNWTYNDSADFLRNKAYPLLEKRTCHAKINGQPNTRWLSTPCFVHMLMDSPKIPFSVLDELERSGVISGNDLRSSLQKKEDAFRQTLSLALENQNLPPVTKKFLRIPKGGHLPTRNLDCFFQHADVVFDIEVDEEAHYTNKKQYPEDYEEKRRSDILAVYPEIVFENVRIDKTTIRAAVEQTLRVILEALEQDQADSDVSGEESSFTEFE